MEVQVEETCFVVPNKKTPTHGLWLSSLDINMLSVGHTPLVYFYRSNSKNASSGFFDIGKLKKALSKTLVPFYPLAGRLGVDSNGRVEIKCNDEGVLFVAARSELSIDDLKDMIKPSLELKSLFIPQIDSAKSPCVVLAVQVTFLRCGGAAVGLAIHHVVVDGPSTFHFLQTWAALARDGDNAVVELPCHDRTLLRACSLAAIHPDTLSVICLKQNLFDSLGPITTKVFSISKHQATSLKRLCGTSTFCAVSAHLWQCMCLARRLPPDAQARLCFPVNIRRRIRPALPNRYFGCAVVEVGTSAVVKDILSEALAAVVKRIKGMVDRVDDELVRSAMAYSETADRSGWPTEGRSMVETELWVISWLNMRTYEVDFGWAKPWVMSRAQSICGGLAYLINAPDDSGVRVVMCMEEGHMDEFERLHYARLDRLLPYARF